MPAHDDSGPRRLRPQTALVAAGRTSGTGQPLNVPLVLPSTFRAGPSTTAG